MSELRDRLTLSEIVGRKVRLTRAGREFKGCCPFHKEKSPSFYVNDDKQFYHCFGCGVHGDAVEFAMQLDNLSFIEAVEMLAAQAGMEVPSQTPQDVEQAKKEKSLHSLMDDAARFFTEILHTTREAAPALSYIKERGMTEDALTAFRIGFSPADGQALRKHLKTRGYSDAQMIEAGALRKSERGGEPYSFFRERIMFPVADRRGRVVAFGGRVMPPHLRSTPPQADGREPPKFINSSDSPLFHKGRMLYAESHARAAAAEGQPVLVVEGYMDVTACWQAGFRGAVAPLGTALTEEQILSLWKMARVPVLCFDGDNAGQRAAGRACERLLPLLKPDHSANIAFLPQGEDPDSLLRGRGAKALQSVLDGAIPLVDFLWNHYTAGRSFETPESRAGLAKTLEAETARIADRDVQQYYKQAFNDRLYRSFRQQNNGLKGKKRPPSEPVLRLSRPGISEAILAQEMMLATVINHPEIFGTAEEELSTLYIENKRLDLVRQTVLNLLGSGEGLDTETVINHLNANGFSEEISALLSPRVYAHAGFSRPGASTEEALEGWRDTWERRHRKAVEREIETGWREVAQDFSAEKEQKVMALHDVHKTESE